jgi:WD40 repeat protein
MSHQDRLLLLAWSVALLAGQARAAAPPHSERPPLPPGAVWRFGSGNLQHELAITSIGYSPDGKMLASCAREDYFLRQWDTASGRLLRTLGLLDNYVSQVTFSPDGKLLAVCYAVYDARLPITLWDVQSWKEIRRFAGPASEMHCIAFTSDSRKLIGGSGNMLHISDVSTGKMLRSVKGHAIDMIAISSDDKTVITRTRAQIHLWDNLAEKEPVILGPRSVYKSMAVVPGNMLALIPHGGHLELWNLARRRLVRSFHCSRGHLDSLAASPDGKLVAAFSGEMVFLWNVTSGKLVQELSFDEGSAATNSDTLRGLTFSPDSKQLAAIKENMIVQWDVNTGMKWMPRGVIPALVRDVQLSSDGRILAMRTLSMVSVWDAESGRVLHQRNNMKTKAMRLDQRGKLLQLWDPATGMHVLDTATGKLSLRWKATPAMKDTNGAVFSPDCRKLLLWSEAHHAAKGKLFQCSAVDGKGFSTISELGEVVGTPLVAFSPDGRFFAETDTRVEWEIRWWATDPITERKRLLPAVKGPPRWYSAMAFSPDGRLFAAGTHGGEILLWDPARGRAITSLKRDDEAINALAFSPDGKMLASDGRDGVVRWEVASGKVRRRFTGHGRAVVSLCFARGSQMLVSGSADRTVLWWDVWGDTDRDGVPQFDSVWMDLLSDDSGRAFRAARSWQRAGGQDLRCLQSHLQNALRPVEPADVLDTALLIQNLDDDSSNVRKNASRHLASLGESVVAALEKARARPLSLEAQLRIDKLLVPWKERRLRNERAWLRVVEMLEQTSTPEAKSMLAHLARKAPSARVTEEAGAALKRREER